MRKLNFYQFVVLIKSFFRLILNLCIGKECCISCSKKTFLAPLCNDCKKKLFGELKTSDNRCKFCSRPLISENEICMECRESLQTRSYSKIYALFTYRLWKKALLFDWKMYGERSLSYFFADCVHKALSELKVFGEINVLVPVPPRPNKIRKKGWDQIAELVSILQKQYGYKVLNLLERVSTFQQKKLNRQERISMQDKTILCQKRLIIIEKINVYQRRLF